MSPPPIGGPLTSSLGIWMAGQSAPTSQPHQMIYSITERLERYEAVALW